MSEKRTMDFQEATACRIADIFEKDKQKRVLLADEVGLGKTVMARAVIDKVRTIRKDWGDDMYRVVYVCSNLNIIKQNMRNLGMDDVLDITDSRLSMQHLTLAERMKKLTDEGKYGEGLMPELLFPLTPGTSFNMSSSLGTMAERALLYDIIVSMSEFSAFESSLNKSFKTTHVINEGTWDYYVRSYKNRIENCASDYLPNVHAALRKQPEFEKFKTDLLNHCHGKEDDAIVHRCILSIRKMSALVSIQQLQPDLVIMDEFQRFSSLLNDEKDDEQNMITREFFGSSSSDGKQQPYILLLSATPYKPYTTLEELNENNCDEQYEDFVSLMDFLFRNHEGLEFSKVWSDYSHSLSQLSTDNFTILLARKQKAEDTLYQGMCRTERPNKSLIKDRHESLPISEGDVLSYAHMQKVFDDCRRLVDKYPEKKLGFNAVNVPMDYVKSSPYLLSFMDNYDLKTKISNIYKAVFPEGEELPVNYRQQTYLLRKNDIEKYAKVNFNNARLTALAREAFNVVKENGKDEINHAERLLWIPTSHPYYTTAKSNVFEKNKGFSKILVFSAWEMVPRMIGCMLSYEAERLTVHSAFEEEKYRKGRTPSLNDALICYPSEYLASLYKSEEFYGQSIDTIRKRLSERIEERMKELNPNVVIEGRECNEPLVLQVAQWLDGESVLEDVRISSRVIRQLVNAAIGSPAVCALRILHDQQMAKDIAMEFRSLFNQRTSGAILALIYERKDQNIYYEQVLDYCVMGNLQAVLDEFAFMIGRDDKNVIYEHMKEAFMGITATLDVDVSTSFAREDKKKQSMRVHYALPFNQAKQDVKKMERSNNVRQAFNSPFRPFVLASTSVGQEGLDFHWYCRKIMHWNLPSNPQDMEQREGRINRFQCLAIRRNIANLYKQYFEWKDMFAEAAKDLHAKYPQYNDMVPYWCLPPELIEEKGDSLERIERIVPNYPLSLDGERYKRLIDVLSLYRLTMGQPRQEELLQLLEGKIHPDQIEQLLFDLSPYSHKKKGE